MTAVQPLSQFHVIQESTTVARARTGSKVSAVGSNDVVADVTEQSNEDSVDAGFCGEPFADNGELLSSLSPLLFCMKLFGLYFHREHRHRPRTDDPEWNPTTTKTCTTSTKLRVYATILLILVWINVVRFTTAFTRSDHVGAILFMKITVFTWCGLFTIFQTTYASHTGQLVKILLALPVTRDCVRGAHRAAIGLTVFIWIGLVIYFVAGGYVFFNSVKEHNFILAPFFTYIDVPDDHMFALKIIGYIAYTLVIPGVLFAHALALVLVYIFYSQFKKLEKNFCDALGKRGEFSGDLSVFRRRHQTLSCAVSEVDDFMMVSNVAGFVCHICNIIILLYSMFFYSETTKDIIASASYVFWLAANITGLFFSAIAGIVVNHMVRICLYTVPYRIQWSK